MDLKPDMVVKFYSHNPLSSCRPSRFMVIESITDDTVSGYRCLRNGQEGARAWGRVSVARKDVLEVVKQSL